MTDTYLTGLRKQLLANGYYPLPGIDKACRLKGWNGKFLEAEAEKYGSLPAAADTWEQRFPRRQTTNVQVRDGLVVIDSDIDDPGLAASFAGRVRDIVPDVFERAPARFGSGEYKVAWFCRLAGGEELFVRHGSRKFTWPGDDSERPAYHHVEVFGGKPLSSGRVSRQFGCFGPHSLAADGSPAVMYSWADGGTLADVALADLPVVTTEQLWALLEQFEADATACGWEPVPEAAGGEGQVLYDIDRESTRFELSDHAWVSYDDLEAMVEAGEEPRLWATFIPGEGQLTERGDRCQAMMSEKYHCTMVYDFKLNNTHLPSDLKPGMAPYAGAITKLKLVPGGRTASPAPALPPAAPAGQINGPLTQDAVALAFAELYVDRLRFCCHAGCWYEWTGFRWKRDETMLALQLCRELSRDKSRAAPTLAELKEARRMNFISAVEKIARGDDRLKVTSDDWDQDPWLVGTPGGTLELRTGLLRGARAADGITKLMKVAPLPGLATPAWDRFLVETFEGDLELIRFNQQWFGYNLTGDVSEHALWFGYGSGGNGKGVLLNTIGAIMGDYAQPAPMETFTAKSFDSHPTELAMLRGARMVTASETEEGRAWAESRIKHLTGGDPVTARFMHKDFFTYSPQFKLSLIGNHKPRLKNVDGAIRRRFRLVPFLNNVPLERQDRQLQEKLKAEWPGIAQWLVEGCLDWQRHGLVIPAAVRQATEGYFEDQDVMGQWLADECEANRNATTASAVLFLSWHRFATAAGHPPGARNAFTMELGRRGFERSRITSTERGVQGLKLKGTPNLKIVVPPLPEEKE
jgi:putative DNA primase/helicase